MTDDQIFSISNTFKFIIKAYKNYFFTFVVISALAGSCMYINQQLLESIIKSAKQIQVKNTSKHITLEKNKNIVEDFILNYEKLSILPLLFLLLILLITLFLFQNLSLLIALWVIDKKNITIPLLIEGIKRIIKCTPSLLAVYFFISSCVVFCIISLFLIQTVLQNILKIIFPFWIIGLITIIIVVFAFMGYIFSPFLILENKAQGSGNALKESQNITGDIKKRLQLLLKLLPPIFLSALIVLIIGMIVTKIAHIFPLLKKVELILQPLSTITNALIFGFAYRTLSRTP